MAYEQVTTILRNVRTFHEHIAEFYTDLRGRVTQERAKLLLDALSEHERLRAQALKDFIGDAPRKVLLSWVSHGQDSAALLSELKAQVNASASLDDLVQLGIDFSEQLLALYEDLASRGEPEEVRELFSSMLAVEREEERQLVRQSLRAMDL